jgi:hypothetical protein
LYAPSPWHGMALILFGGYWLYPAVVDNHRINSDGRLMYPVSFDKGTRLVFPLPNKLMVHIYV